MFAIMNNRNIVLFFPKKMLTKCGGGGVIIQIVQNSEYSSQIRIREEREIWGYPNLQLKSC